MKKIVKFIVVLLIVWTCLSLTNPSYEDYKNHVRSKMSEGHQNIFVRVGSYLLSEAAEELVLRYDYKIFSFYSIEDPFGGYHTSFGILKIFIDY